MRRLFILATLLAATAMPVRSQSSTTNTNCQANGQQINCTSQTTANAPPPSTDATTAEQQREANEAGKAIGTAIGTSIAKRKQEKQLEEGIAIRVTYCNQNPQGSVTLTDGKSQSCDEELSKVKAICTVKPKYSFCKYLSDAQAKK